MRHKTVVSERVAGLHRLGDERWILHRRAHDDLAASLADYKSSANEWRATLADIRGALITRPEYNAEHKALRTEIVAIVARLETRVDIVERALQALGDRDRTTRDLLNNARNLIILGFVITTGLLGIIAYFGK